MQILDGQNLFSATDLVNFLECEHTATLGLVNLATPLQRAADDESNKLIQDKGYEHEAAFLAALKAQGRSVKEIPQEGSVAEAARATIDAMAAGHDVVFQATLISGSLYGRADFLQRVEGQSRFGPWQYEVMDTKLARSVKAKFVVQLCYYSELLAEAQQAEPKMMHVVLGDGTQESFRFANYSRYFRKARDRFLAFAGGHPNDTYPQRVEYCGLCAWRELCEQRWLDDDYPNQVAGIRRDQLDKLLAQDVRTMDALATLDAKTSVAKMQPDTLARLRAQAILQIHKRRTGESKVEHLPLDPDGRRGFFRLPEADEGDVFFDMEGDPLAEDGLEYLFGIRYREGGDYIFKPFWAHDRVEEKLAFESFMDFLRERARAFPDMHVYHYAPYEPNALKRLMSLHGVREAQVDDLLRDRKLVDLYAVVREAIRTSEPGLSIKDIECFYMPAREGEVVDAGASIVKYEHWRTTGDKSALEAIERYNDDDCRSTQLLRDWLIGMRPPELPWFTPEVEEDAGGQEKSQKTEEIEAKLARLGSQLLDDPLVRDLLDFHRRCAKPEWWAVFARQDMTEEELIEDFECLGGLQWDGTREPIARSFLYGFSYPEQDTKLREGSSVRRADTAASLGTIAAIDEARRHLQIKIAAKKGAPPARLSVGPSGPIGTDSLRLAVWRFAESVIAGDGRFMALRKFLRKDAPLANFPKRTGDVVDRAVSAVTALDNSYLFVQGPPGAGKTTTGSRLIVRLLAAGKRVGITSNGHKAINNLLEAVVECAKREKVRFRGVKKCGRGEDQEFESDMIENVYDNADVVAGSYQFLAGTAWLFADPRLEQSIDYLFVDEAGQVSLANLVAAGTSARNIVLLGDQMQLSQPIKGVHPGRSGHSTLDYLLDGAATVADDRGIFLPTSWRMHPDICRFISEAVYDSKLEPEANNSRQRIVLADGAHPVLRPTGIRFLPIVHEGCSQKCEAEAAVVKDLVESLLKQSYVDRDGATHPVTLDEILVVAPYNAQVNLLRQVLPPDTRVGTIDKFQGQQAQVVIVSMTTSSGEFLPRNIEFLYDKNRLNVAVSRAKSLAIVLASPALLHVACSSAEQIELVNTLCWLEEYSSVTQAAKS
jgi:predicted RecB family nuclease